MATLRTTLYTLLIVYLSSQSTCHGETEIITGEGEKTDSAIRGMFVFGSSLVDNGNNNFIEKSLAKANYLPYGVDFPAGPSGRFTNGKNVVDLIGDKLGLKAYVPAFADPSTKGSRLLHGVNFASGASGILDDTGSIAGNVISFNQQIRNFEGKTLREVELEVGRSTSKSNESSSSWIGERYLFVVGSGSNDYSFNYFLRALSRNVTLQAFTANLTASLSTKIKKLYKLGGRKFVLMSINPIGCSPMVITVGRETQNNPNTRCVQEMNVAARLFNANLRSLVDRLRPKMPGSTLLFVNSYKIIRDIIRNPSSKGFSEASKPCCEISSVSEGGNGILCKKEGRVCEDRKAHVFFDGLHPTESVNFHIANKAFSSKLKTEVYPINIQQLAQVI